MSDRGHYEQAALWGSRNVALPDHQEVRLAEIDRLIPSEVRSIVDVGAGDGRVLHHLRTSRGSGVTSIAAERSLEALGHVDGPIPVQASIDALPLRDRAAELVLCCEVLEHLPGPTFRAGLAELGRIADRYILITVPNREVRARADVVCNECGCRYNRERHLRSFGAEGLRDLLPGFELSVTSATGPHQPVYPRVLRVQMERMGLLPILGSPSCPQCGNAYGLDRHDATTASSPSSTGSRYRALRRLVPKQRHPYWLCALFTRRALS
jgi:hypothetical protein